MHRSVILGSCDTPYAFGFFHFRGTYPQNYPNQAPQVVITTTEHGRVRFNPNLYAEGKGNVGRWNSAGKLASKHTGWGVFTVARRERHSAVALFLWPVY